MRFTVFTITILVLVLGCRTVKNSKYQSIPKNVRKSVEKNYSNGHSFFYMKNSSCYYIWNYDHENVHWKYYTNGRVEKSGEFKSLIDTQIFVGRNQNDVLVESVDSLVKAPFCSDVLDTNSKFGFIIFAWYYELVGYNSINVKSCVNNSNSFIVKDLDYMLNGFK